MIYVVIGLLSGIISGMGIGGGTILIPALCFFTDLGQQQAQSINLLFFIPTAVVAIIKHKKEGSIDFSLAKPVILFGILGAVAGSMVAVNMDGELFEEVVWRFFTGNGCMGNI